MNGQIMTQKNRSSSFGSAAVLSACFALVAASGLVRHSGSKDKILDLAETAIFATITTIAGVKAVRNGGKKASGKPAVGLHETYALTERASEAQRRGDYLGALGLLLEAKKTNSLDSGDRLRSVWTSPLWADIYDSLLELKAQIIDIQISRLESEMWSGGKNAPRLLLGNGPQTRVLPPPSI